MNKLKFALPVVIAFITGIAFVYSCGDDGGGSSATGASTGAPGILTIAPGASVLSFGRIALFTNGGQTTAVGQIKFVVPTAITIRSMHVNVGTNSLNGDTIFTLVKGSSNTAIAVTYPVPRTGYISHTTDSVSFAAGDSFVITGNSSASTSGSMGPITFTLEYD